MVFKPFIRRPKFYRSVQSCYFCTAVEQGNPDSSVKTDLPKEKSLLNSQKLTGVRLKKHIAELKHFFNKNPHIGAYQAFIPNDIMKKKPYKAPEYVYLICPDIARKVANHILNHTGPNQIIAETNPGLGLITQVLLKEGVSNLRLYELNHGFHNYLQGTFSSECDKVKLFKKDFFTMHKYAFYDSLDQGERVKSMLQGVAKKNWTEEPIMTIVGTITKYVFLKYLIRCIVLQKDLATYGRLDFFLICYSNLKNMFDDKIKIHKQSRAWVTLFNIFLKCELLDEFPRTSFLPWQGHSKEQQNPEPLYLLRITIKKELSITESEYIPFYGFIKNVYGRGNLNVIPTCE
ncbi:hypothetical protein ABEB36_002567 [Hypothenemus hampei]